MHLQTNDTPQESVGTEPPAAVLAWRHCEQKGADVLLLSGFRSARLTAQIVTLLPKPDAFAPCLTKESLTLPTPERPTDTHTAGPGTTPRFCLYWSPSLGAHPESHNQAAVGGRCGKVTVKTRSSAQSPAFVTKLQDAGRPP